LYFEAMYLTHTVVHRDPVYCMSAVCVLLKYGMLTS
jgi:hypothetical protein